MDIMINIDFTTICNANCIFCNYGIKKETKENLDIKTLNKFLNLLDKISIDYVSLTPQTGDITLNKNYIELIKCIIDKKLSIKNGIYLYTNLINLRLEDAEYILGSGISKIIISTSGFEEARYKSIFRSTQYQKVLNNIVMLAEIKKNKSLAARIVIDLKSSTINEEIQKIDYKKYIYAFVNQGIIELAETPILYNFLDIFTEHSELKQLQIKNNIDIRYSDPSPNEKKKRSLFPCTYLSKLALRPNGDIRLCNCVFSSAISGQPDKLLLGNIHEISTAIKNDLLENHKKIMNLWSQGDFPNRCGSCQMYEPDTSQSINSKINLLTQVTS